MAPAILAYWDIRGLAQPIRLLLEYVGTEWEDKLYVCGPGPTYDKTCWFDIKNSLGLDFPNLPYFIDGNIKLTQSGAILRYLAMKFGLDGETQDEKIRIELLAGVCQDYYSEFVRMSYNPDFEKIKGPYLENLPNKLKLLSDYLGDRKFFAGENISFVDFALYEMLDQNKILEPNCLNNFEKLKKYQERFESIPPITNYMESSRFIKYPLNNRMAKFGG